MNVTLITMAYPHPRAGFWPGIERQVAGFAAGLRDAGAKVTVVTSFRNGGPARETHDGIRIFRVSDTGHRFGRPGYLLNMHVRSLGANAVRLAEAIEGADVIETFIPLPDAPALRRPGLPVYAFFPHRDQAMKWSDYLLHPIHFMMEKRFFRRARAIFVASAESSRVLAAEYGVPESKVIVVPLGVSPAFLNEAPAAAPRARFRMLYVGLLIRRKGLRTLIDALPLVARKTPLTFELQIAGSGPDRDDLRDRAARAGVADRVTFLGRVEERDLPALYRGADLFVFPSVKEGFGLVLVEAMASGLPVVASAVAPLPEVVGEAGLFFRREDPGDLAAAIVRIMDDPALGRRLGAEGRRRVEERYLWSRIAERTLAIYRQGMAS